MKSVEEILAQVNANLPKVDTVPDAKKQAVAAASQAKMAAMGAQATPQDFANAAIARASNGQGYTSANEVGRALIEDSPIQLYDKFGVDVAQKLIEERALATGSNNLARQQLQGRTTPEAVKDTAVGVTQGVVGLATGLGTLTASGVDAALGTDLAVDAAAFNKAASEFIKQGYSDEVTADDKLSAARMRLNQRDNAYIAAQEEMNGVDPLNAGAKRILQDFGDQLGELGNSEFQAERVISEGVGSMLPIGMISKGVAATGRAALGAATTGGILAAEGKAAIALAKYGNAIRTPAVIGATEGGSAGADTINQVMAMTPEQLSADPEFGSKFEALAADIGVERAKREIAIEAGDTSIVVGGLAGAAIGRIASKFEGDLFAKVGTKQAVGNITRQGVEETGQGMVSQFGTNLAIQQNADSNKELTDTVGSAGALGLVGGLGAAASVSPASTTKAVLAPATYLGSKLVDKIVSIGESIEASAQAASPVSDQNVMKAATAAQDTVATARQEAADLVTADISPEAKASSAYVTALADVLEFTPPQPDEIPADIHDALLGKTSVVDVLQAIPKALNDSKVSEASKNILVSFALNAMLNIKNTVAQGEDSLSVDSKYENLAQYAQAYEGVLKGLLQSPATQSVAAHFNTLIEDGLKTGLLKPIEPSKLAEPEEQANLDKIITIAQNTEGTIPESVAGTIMDMAANPPVGLTAKQGSALKAIAAELIAAKEYAAKAEELGLKKVEFVSKQITTNEESDNPKGQNSARIHARGISAAIMAGKPKEAKARITELANFVTHLNNKVKALNEHIAAGMPKGGVYYQAYKVKNSSKPWSKSRKALSYQKSNPEFARTIALEAATLASIYENLRKAFPELKAPKIAPISLVEGATAVATQTQEDAVPTTNQSGRTAAEVEGDKKVSKELRAKFQIGEASSKKEIADKITAMDKDALLAVKAVIMKYSAPVRSKSPRVKFVIEQLITRNAEFAKDVKVETPTDPAPTADTKVETAPVSQLTPDAKVETPTNEQEVTTTNENPNPLVQSKAETEEADTKVETGIEEVSVTETATKTEPDKKDKVTLKSIFANLLLPNNNKFLQAFKLTSRSRFLLAEGSLFENISKAISSPQAMAKFMGEEVSAKHLRLTPALSQAYKNLLQSYRASIYAGLNGEIKNILGKAVVTDKTSLPVIYRILRNELQAKTEDKSAALQALIDGSHKGTTESLQKLVDGYQTADATSRLLNKELKAEQATLDALKAAKIPDPKAITAQQVVVQKLFTEIRLLELDRRPDLKNVLTDLKKNLVKNWKTLDPYLMAIRADLHTAENGRLLNFVEVNADGAYVLNTKIANIAVMATLQWAMEISQSVPGKLEAKDVAALTGLDISKVTLSLINEVNSGVTQIKAIESLSQLIQGMLGLKSNSKEVMGNTDGIIRGLAASLIALVREGKTNADAGRVLIGVSEPTNLGEKLPKHVNIYKPMIKASETAFAEFSDLFEMLADTEFTPDVFVGSDVTIPVNKSVLNSPLLPLTDAQIKAVEKAQAVEQKLDEGVLEFYQQLGEEGFIEVFGEGEIDVSLHNKVDAESKSSRNKVLLQGWKHIQAVLAEAKAYAEHTNTALKDVVVRYASDMSSVSRLQYRGVSNQSNKLVRSLITPTITTIKFDDAEKVTVYKLALAQAMGIKIHNMSTEQALTKLSELMSDPIVKEAYSLIKRKEITPSNFSVLKAAKNKVDGTIRGMTALMDAARYQQMKEDGKEEFVTSVAIEADGVTNGIANALHLLGNEPITEQMLANWKATGYFVGSRDRTLNQERQVNSLDMYTVIAAKASKYVEASRKAIMKGVDKKAPVINQMMEMFRLLSSDVEFDAESGMITIKRSGTKNPTTISLYGSSENGIAAKVANALLQELYATMSEWIQSDDKTPRNYHEIKAAFQAITGNELGFNGTKNTWFIKSNGTSFFPNNREQLLDFQIKPDLFEVMQNNIKRLYVAPMRAAIDDVLGSGVMDAMTTVIQTTSIQSLIMKARFEKAVKEAVKLKAKTVPGYRESDYLSKDELTQIHIEVVRSSFGMYSNGEQNFLVAGSVSSDAVNTGGKIASSTSGAVSSKPVVQSFENSGVAGAPVLNIGLGDAYAVIRALINDKTPANLLWVFDGIEASINDIAALAEVANEAVRDSWFNQSPAKVVAESWKKFAPTITKEDMSSELVAALSKTTGLDVRELDPEFAKTYVSDFMNNRIQDLATKTEAMQSVKRELVSSIDQMASIGIPFTNEGSVDLSGKTDAEIIKTINTMFKEKLPKKDEPAESKTHPTTKAVANGLMEAVQSILGGYRNKTTGVYAFKGEQLDKLLKHLKNLPANQRRVYNDVISVAAKSLADINIVIGSFEETVEHFKDNEQISNHFANKPNTQGTYFSGLNTIVIRADRTETLIHELIHATTMKAVKDYLLHKTNPAKYPLPDVKLKALTESVENIMKMMNDFYSDQYIMNLDSSAVAKYEHVKDVIKKNLTKAQAAGTTEDAAVYQAVAVDEFLAYILASETLAEAASKTTTATGSSFREFIKQMAIKIGKSIAALFKTSTEFNQGRDDLFNNLVFNSTILASYNNKPSFLENLVPFMNQDGFEDVDRLQALQDSVKNAVAAFMDTTSVPKDKVADAIYNEMKVVNSLKLAKEASATIVGAGFQLNALEQQTYEVLLTAMIAGLKLNSVALGKIQTIYGEFSKQLTAKDFLDPSLSENTGRYVAGNKLAIILGQFNNAKLKNIDVLASFVALSAVSPELQALLNKFTMPEKAKAKGDKFDVAVTRVGEELTNALSGYLSSGSKNKAVDDLVFDLVEILFKADAANKFVSSSVAVAVAEGINSANEYVSENLQKGAKTVHDKAAKVSANSNNRVVKFIAHAAMAPSIIVDKDIANMAAENTNKFINGLEGYDSVRAALSDIIGRTTTNSGVYDLIKPIRVFVAKARQEFKERVPSIIKEKFTNVLSETEWSHVNTVIANTNLASLGAVEALAVLSGKRDVNKMVSDLERNLKTTNSKYFGLVQGKAKQLANFMVTGEAGDMLLRNSFAISKLYGMNVKDTSYANTAYINKVERLVSLYALQAMSQEQLNAVEEIANANSKGMLFVLTYMKGIAEENQRKVNNSSLARDNGYTGFLSNIQESSSKLIVASDTEYAKLIALGFTRIDDYKGDPRESMSEAHGYYFNAASVNRMFQQGTIQNVHVTVSGVNVYTGWTDGSPVAGRITDAIEIAKILSRKGKASKEPLLPLFDSTGSVIAFERSLSVEKKALIEYSTDLAKRLGATRGRQHEELMSQHYNQVVIDNLKQMYDEDPNKSQYVDLFDNKALAKDPVLKDAVTLFTEAVREQIKDQFGEEFYVKREVLMDVVGYRAASLTDPWTGVSRLSPKTLKTMKGIAYAILGKDAFTILNQYEDSHQAAIAFIKTNIVVKSVVVPFANIMGNIVHLKSVGVSLYDIYKQVPKKMLELEYFITSQHRLTQIEAELFAAKTLSNKFEAHKLEAESKSIHAALDKLSIIDLINAGELSNINDIGFVDEDASLLKGNFKKYFDDLLEEIPEGVKIVGKHLIVGKDTALFAGLQKSVLYGDFIAKAILFDSLVQKGQSKDDVLARISEEFVNYDKLPGRGRGYLESMGLLWFYNFKLRSIKVALSAMRNNPLHVLIASLGIGYPLGVETGIGDNAIAQVLEGSIGYSIGIDMGISGLSANPYANMIH